MIDEHAAAVYRLALGIVRDPSLAEDVVQETMIRAWSAHDRHRGTGSERSWVLSIAHNTAVSMLRRSRDHVTSPDDMPDRLEPFDTEVEAEGRERMERAREALAGLDDLSRTVVVMRDVEGLSYAQIADALDVTIPTVKTRLLRARRDLQRVVRAGERT
jgi:RNA polymerase sigma-70 factor (ECF subfamily)